MLMKEMWQSTSTIQPRVFKKRIGQLNEQFSGFGQQDSQELLSFLLDSLHEEMNLRIDKPYVENPDSDGRDITDLANECWANQLRRNWSIFYFLFYGQLKSHLNCKVCNKVSITFDNFTSIAMPLPEPSQLIMDIVVFRLPSQIKDILRGKVKLPGSRMGERSEVESVQSARSSVVQEMPDENEAPNLEKFQSTFKRI